MKLHDEDDIPDEELKYAFDEIIKSIALDKNRYDLTKPREEIHSTLKSNELTD